MSTKARLQRQVAQQNVEQRRGAIDYYQAEVTQYTSPGRPDDDCPNFAFLLSCPSSAAEAHKEMMRRARIKV